MAEVWQQPPGVPGLVSPCEGRRPSCTQHLCARTPERERPEGQGRGRGEAAPVPSQHPRPSLLPVWLPRELMGRRKARLPADDVVQTPRKLHGGSYPSPEAGANQSNHVLGEN